MNTYKIGFKESDTIEACTIDYIYTDKGGEYNMETDNAALKSMVVSHAINTLEVLEVIMEWVKAVKIASGTHVMVNVTLTEEAEQGLDTDLNDSFFIREADKNIETLAREFMFIDRDDYDKEDDFFKAVESLWDMWNTEVKLHVWNKYNLNQ